MARIYTYGELKESKLIYDRKPPAFGVIITFMTLIFVVAALFWAGFSTKTYVVKATGFVVSSEKTNIMNGVSGAISEIAVEEGQRVEEGDVLIQIDSLQVQLQIAQLKSMKAFTEKKIAAVSKLINFINGYSVLDTDTQTNPFQKDDAEEAKYYGDAQSFIDFCKNNSGPDGQVGTDDDAPKTQEEIDGVKGSFLSQQGHYTALDQYNAQSAETQSQITMYTDSLSAYTIKAGQRGIVHLSAGMTEGTVIQAGSLLGSISSEDEASLYFETVLNAADRSKIDIEDSVEIALSGVMQSEFGLLNGKVIAIDNDSTQTEDGKVFYRVKIKPNKTQLEDKKGNVVNLTTGMLAESRIKYDETTWLKWMVEQIGIKF